MYIIGTKKGETAIKLAKTLKNCEGGYDYPFEEDFYVNYGRIDVRNIANLNARLINNKLLQLRKMRESNSDVNVPYYYEFYDRRSLLSVPNSFFPCIARKYYHTKGKDAIFLKTKFSLRRRLNRVLRRRNYLVKYIPKRAEFRVHVLGREIAGVSIKVKNREVSEHHPYIWSRERGWIQLDYNSDGRYYNELSDIAVKCCEIMGYDFGAVDIMLGKDGLFYFLEINSAPRLNLRRRRLYAKFIRKKWKEYQTRRNNEIL